MKESAPFFQTVTGDHASFKGVSLEAFLSRKGLVMAVSIESSSSMHELIDNINSKMVNSRNEGEIE